MEEEKSSEVELNKISTTSEYKKSVIQNFNQHNYYSLSELPPLTQLDSASPEVRDFVIKAYSKEQEFRHDIITKNENNSSEFELRKLELEHKQRQLGSISGIGLVIACLAWSAYLVSKGLHIQGMTPFIAAVGGLVFAAIWGKKKKKAENSDSAD